MSPRSRLKIAVLGSPLSWYLEDLIRAAGDRHVVFPATFRDLQSGILGEAVEFASGGTDLDAVDCVLVRTMAPGSLEQVVFRMDVLSRLQASGVAVINPSRAVEAAVDKYLATAKLVAAGLSVPRTVTCQSPEPAVEAFHRLGQDVVVKPLFGSEGRGMMRITDEGLMMRAANALQQLGAVIYLQEFIDHGDCDYRLLVVGESVLGICRRNPDDWRSNISRGATSEPLEVTPELADLGRRAARAVEAPLAGVDVLPRPDGQLYVVEVNAVPGWKGLGETLGVDVAGMVLRYVERVVGDELEITKNKSQIINKLQ